MHACTSSLRSPSLSQHWAFQVPQQPVEVTRSPNPTPQLVQPADRD